MIIQLLANCRAKLKKRIRTYNLNNQKPNMKPRVNKVDL